MTITVLPTDKAFKNSPDAGHPACLCSRCEARILKEEAPVIRCWTENEKGEVDENSLEYRFCTKCLASMGIALSPSLKIGNHAY